VVLRELPDKDSKWVKGTWLEVRQRVLWSSIHPITRSTPCRLQSFDHHTVLMRPLKQVTNSKPLGFPTGGIVPVMSGGLNPEDDEIQGPELTSGTVLDPSEESQDETSDPPAWPTREQAR
jgi:hypothetical protein